MVECHYATFAAHECMLIFCHSDERCAQDYARHLVNSYVVSEKTGDALAAGMLDLARNATLRQHLAAHGSYTARNHYDPHRIGRHGAAVFR